MVIELWTDGSGTRAGPIGWAWVLRAFDDQGELVAERTGGGFGDDGTNNRAELMALLDGLRALHQSSHVVVFTDSEYVMKPWTEGYLARWIERGWRKTTGGPVLNADLWRAIVEAASPHRIEWRYVEGHTGVDLNERCDRLAGAARRVVKAELEPEQEEAKAA